MCVDYRKPDSLLPSVTPATGTKKGALALVPLSKIDELFPLLRGARYFTALDLCSGYYYTKLDKSVFATVFGKFKFLRLPFGVSQGPDLFIRLIYDLLRLVKTSNQSQGSGYVAYQDDILIYSKTEKEHLEILNYAFKHLSKVGIKIKLRTYSFFKEIMHYLGHLVSGTSILPPTDKVETVMKLKPLTNIKEVRHFLGLTGYYRKFIFNYSDITHPLNCLPQKSQPFI